MTAPKPMDTTAPKPTAEADSVRYADELGVPVCRLACIVFLAKSEAFEEAADMMAIRGRDLRDVRGLVEPYFKSMSLRFLRKAKEQIHG